MSEPNDPFEGQKDPFVPETVRVPLGDGTDAIDLFATSQNHIESMVPQIDSTSMREGDVLTVEFDNDHEETFQVTSMNAGSLVFGSDGVREKEMRMKPLAETGEQEQDIEFYGSSVFPNGDFRTSGMVRVGSHLVMDIGVSSAAVRSFDLKRPDENGNLQAVLLNKEEAPKPESKSFAYAKKAFETVSGLLQKEGFQFDQIDEEGFLHKRYIKQIGNLLVYAARQGFGSGVVPQDEVYAYDAKAKVLRAIRNIPTLGIMQVGVVKDVSKEDFQEAAIAYRDGTYPDWRYARYVDGTTVHRLSHTSPVTTYTWLSQDQDAPIITLLEDGENISDLFKTLSQRGIMMAQSMRANDAEDLVDIASEMFGIDPNGGDFLYEELEVNLGPGKKPEIRPSSQFLWDTEEAAAEFADRLSQAVSVSHDKGYTQLTVDGHNIRVKTDPRQEIDKLTKTTRLAIGKTPKTIGSRMLGRVRVSRRNGS